MQTFLSLSQGSELGSWTLGHWTEDGADIFQNFPDLNSVYWDAEDKGMVPKLTPNHHVPIPDGYLAENGPVRITYQSYKGCKGHVIVTWSK